MGPCSPALSGTRPRIGATSAQALVAMEGTNTRPGPCGWERPPKEIPSARNHSIPGSKTGNAGNADKTFHTLQRRRGCTPRTGTEDASKTATHPDRGRPTEKNPGRAGAAHGTRVESRCGSDGCRAGKGRILEIKKTYSCGCFAVSLCADPRLCGVLFACVARHRFEALR